MKHTKGPWKYSLAVVSNAPSVHVVTTGKWGAPTIAIVDTEENAILMAAAPELLDAGKAFVAFFREYEGKQAFEECMQGSPALKALIAAISKAEGKP